ncbi:MAG: hypothetical protein AAGD05_13075, partial [Bacteroidota bacterium]
CVWRHFKTNQYFEFSRVPKNEKAYIVGLILTEQKEIKLGIKAIKIDNNDLALSFETIPSIEELEEKLKPIN